MRFQALLAFADENASEALSQALENFPVNAEICPPQASKPKLQETRCDLLFVDFDENSTAAELIQTARQSSASKTCIAIALVSDTNKTGSAFGTGANLVLYKPLVSETVSSTLRAAIALLKRERRRQFRVPVQLPVTLISDHDSDIEGIMLDLSEGGMDVLAAKPLERQQRIQAQFDLSSTSRIKIHGKVVWANPNGQSGLQFLDVTEEQRTALCTWLSANAPEIPPEEPEPFTDCKLSDLSLGACYVETSSPFPKRTRVELVLRAGDFDVRLDGVVQVVHPAHGMGIEFANEGDQPHRIEDFIEHLSASPGLAPQLLVCPKSISFTEDGFPTTQDEIGDEDPLVRLLHNPESISQDQFLAELRSQRHGQTEATIA